MIKLTQTKFGHFVHLDGVRTVPDIPESAINIKVDIHDVESLGDLENGSATLKYHHRGTNSRLTIPMTPEVHADIKSHINIEETSRVAGEPYTPPTEAVAISAENVEVRDVLNAPFSLQAFLTKLVSRLAIVEGSVDFLMRMGETQKYTSYKLDGTTISGFYGTRSKAICKYDLAKGFRFEQRPFTSDVEDSRHVVSLHTANLGIITFLSANSGMAGAVEAAMDNGTDIAQTPHTSEVIAGETT